MRNFKVLISYKGTNYHGWQRQNNAVTVQQTVEEAISKLIGAPVAVNGCSRTDTGVHPFRFCFNFKHDCSIPCDGFVKGLNALLPDDIYVISCEEESDDFHARFSAKGKEYTYIVSNANKMRALYYDTCLFYDKELDVECMNNAAKLFIGEHDFGAYCKAEAKDHLATTVREIWDFSVSKSDSIISFTVSGNGFLHNMVRILVGTLIYISEGKRTEEDIIKSLQTGDRELAGMTAPPNGLYLNRIIYNERNDE